MCAKNCGSGVARRAAAAKAKKAAAKKPAKRRAKRAVKPTLSLRVAQVGAKALTVVIDAGNSVAGAFRRLWR